MRFTSYPALTKKAARDKRGDVIKENDSGEDVLVDAGCSLSLTLLVRLQLFCSNEDLGCIRKTGERVQEWR